MLLTRRVIDDTILPVRLHSFQQWVACVTMIAVLFGTATPLGFCRCVGCHCESSISRLFPDFAVENAKCCCIPPEPLPDEECCGQPKMPCPCSCCNIQADDADAPVPALLVKQPNVNPSWNIVSVVLVGYANALGAFSPLGNHRAMPPPHVPLHVLLCVFLN